MRIAINGMNGCKKTTILKILVEKLGYKYVDKLFNFLSPLPTKRIAS